MKAAPKVRTALPVRDVVTEVSNEHGKLLSLEIADARSMTRDVPKWR